MSKIAIYTDTNNLLNGISHLGINELEDLARSLNHLISQKRGLSLSKKASELYIAHNSTVLSKEKQKKLRKLSLKLEETTLSEEERKILISIAEEEENLRNQRLTYLIELADIQKTTVPNLMREMGLKPIIS